MAIFVSRHYNLWIEIFQTKDSSRSVYALSCSLRITYQTDHNSASINYAHCCVNDFFSFEMDMDCSVQCVLSRLTRFSRFNDLWFWHSTTWHGILLSKSCVIHEFSCIFFLFHFVFHFFSWIPAKLIRGTNWSPLAKNIFLIRFVEKKKYLIGDGFHFLLSILNLSPEFRKLFFWIRCFSQIAYSRALIISNYFTLS